MKPNAILIRYSEVFLKGGRRPLFISLLKKALERQVTPVGPYKIKEIYGHLLVVHKDATPHVFPDIQRDSGVEQGIMRTFGVSSWSYCRLVPREWGQMEISAKEIAETDVVGKTSFKISASRADKDFPLNSMEINKRLGALIYSLTKVDVKMKDPEVVIHCHILPKFAVFYLDIMAGPGGLPIGTEGKVLLLLSGGIDSPVAGYLMMRRGCEVDAIHFESIPYTTLDARKKVEILAGKLASFEPSLRLFLSPFGAIQAELKERAPARLLVVLYRRMMMRIACRIADRCNAICLATGENIGQVASQTLQNMAVIEEASSLPILRPLLTYDKVETIQLAKRIGTYETSILPYEDCCSLFVPDHPETRADLDKVRLVESQIPLNHLIEEAISATEVMEIKR